MNRKSTLVEEAVEEVLSLVQKANESVKIPKLEHEPSFKGTSVDLSWYFNVLFEQ